MEKNRDALTPSQKFKVKISDGDNLLYFYI